MTKKDNILTTLTFECTYGDITTTEEPKLYVKEPGVYLHFLRYGLFDRGTDKNNLYDIDYENGVDDIDNKKAAEKEATFLQFKKDYLKRLEVKRDNTYVATKQQQFNSNQQNYETAIELDEVIVIGKKLKIEGLPDLDNFYLSKTVLNQGYVYLINDDDINDYYELEVLPDGTMRHICWNYSKNKDKNGKILDVRVANSQEDGIISAKRVDKIGKKLWVAYTPVQWSREYHSKLLNDIDLRKKRMKLIDCTPLKKDEERSPKNEYEIAPCNYQNAYGLFADKTDPRIKEFHTKLQDIHADEKYEDNHTDNTVYQDLFFVLDDPIGIAEDVGELLDDAHHKHRATLESMQTGESEFKIFDRLKNKYDSHSNFITTNYGQQANALFTTALTLNSFINSNSEIEDKYAKHIDFEKVNTILGFEYRKKQRKIITKYRNDYFKIITSKYYKTAFCDGLRGNNQDTFESRCIIASQLSLLTEHPQHKDRFIDPKKAYKGNNDKDYDDFIAASVNNNDEHYQLFTKKINTDAIEQSVIAAKIGFKISRRVIKSLKDVTTAYTKHAVRVKNFDIIDKTVKAFKDSKGWNIKIKTQNAHIKAPKGFELNTAFIEETASSAFGNKGKTIKIQTTKGLAQHAANTKTINLPFKGLNNNTSKLLKKVLDSPHFRKWMAGLELINILIKTKSLYDKNNWKNRISLFGAGSSLTSAVLAYQEASLKITGAADDVVLKVSRYSKFSGLVGSAVSVGMCVWDTVESIQFSDYDAAAAWGATAIVSGVLLADGIVAFNAWLATGVATGFLSFGFTLVLSILFIGGVMLAIYLTDNALEKFLKNNILSTERKHKPYTTIPYIYVKELYDLKDKLVDNEVKHWRNFVKASDDLYDILISYKVTDNINLNNLVNPNKQKPTSFTDYFKEAIRLTMIPTLLVPKQFTINVTLRKFFYDKSEFRYALALFPKNIKHSSKQTPIFLTDTRTILKNHNGTDNLCITIYLDKTIQKLISLGSEFVFFSNTLINKEFNEYWPSQRGTTRYHAFKFDAFRQQANTTSQSQNLMALELSDTINNYLGENVRTGTIQELTEPKIWK